MIFLIVWGENEKRPTWEEGRRLNREIEESTLVLIKECGHMVPEEKPEELARMILEFLG